MKKKKLVWLLVALGVVVIGVGGYFGYQTYQNQQVKHSKSSASSSTKPKDATTSKNAATSSNANSSTSASESSHSTVISSGNKATVWTTNQNLTQTLTNGAIQYDATGVKVMQNDPQTDEAVQMAQAALNVNSITGPYTTIILSYKITNNSQVAVRTNGVEQIGFSDNSLVNAMGGLDNDSQLATKTIAAGQTVETFSVALVPSSLAKTVNQVQVQFDVVQNVTDNSDVAGTSGPLTVKF